MANAGNVVIEKRAGFCAAGFANHQEPDLHEEQSFWLMRSFRNSGSIQTECSRFGQNSACPNLSNPLTVYTCPTIFLNSFVVLITFFLNPEGNTISGLPVTSTLSPILNLRRGIENESCALSQNKLYFLRFSSRVLRLIPRISAARPMR